MNNNIADTHVTIASTAGGVLLAVMNIQSGEILKTATLAAVGAVVSFGVSVLMKFLYRRLARER